VVEHLPSKCKALSSNPGTQKENVVYMAMRSYFEHCNKEMLARKEFSFPIHFHFKMWYFASRRISMNKLTRAL
jgi:hypothetical protein